MLPCAALIYNILYFDCIWCVSCFTIVHFPSQWEPSWARGILGDIRKQRSKLRAARKWAPVRSRKNMLRDESMSFGLIILLLIQMRSEAIGPSREEAPLVYLQYFFHVKWGAFRVKWGLTLWLGPRIKHTEHNLMRDLEVVIHGCFSQWTETC